jgi:hypothetical protein
VAGLLLVFRSGQVQSIDLDTDTLGSYLSYPSGIQGIQRTLVIDNVVYGTDAANDAVLKIDTATVTTSTVAVHDFPRELAYDGTDIYVGSATTADLSIINESTFTVTTSANTTGVPVSVTWLNPYVWFVSNDRYVRAYDPTTNSIASSMQLPVGSFATRITNDGEYLYAASDSTNRLHKIDPSTLTSVADIAIAAVPQSPIVSGSDLFIGGLNANTVQRVDLTTFSTTATITGFNAPIALAATPGMLYVANQLVNTVHRVDLSTNAIAASITGIPGRALAYVPPTPTAGWVVGSVGW